MNPTLACVHRWGPAQRIGRVKCRWHCRKCTAIRTSDGDAPVPGTLAEASEAFTTAAHNLAVSTRWLLSRNGLCNTIPDGLYRRLPTFAQRWLLGD